MRWNYGNGLFVLLAVFVTLSGGCVADTNEGELEGVDSADSELRLTGIVRLPRRLTAKSPSTPIAHSEQEAEHHIKRFLQELWYGAGEEPEELDEGYSIEVECEECVPNPYSRTGYSMTCYAYGREYSSHSVPCIIEVDDDGNPTR